MPAGDEILDLRLDLRRQRRFPVLAEGLEGDDVDHLHLAAIAGLAAADQHLDLAVLVRNARDAFAAVVFPTGQIQPVGEGCVETGVGEVLDLVERSGRTKQPVAHRAVAALRLLVQQGEDPQPQGPQVIRMHRERHRFRIAAGDGL